MLRLSLRARVLAGMGVVVLALVVAAVLVTTTMRDHLLDQIDARLAAAAGPDDSYRRHPAREPPNDDALEGPERPSDIYVGFIGADGVLRAEFNSDLTGAQVPPPAVDRQQAEASLAAGKPFTVDAADQSSARYRVLARPGPDGEIAVVATSLGDVDDTIDSLVVLEIAVTAITVAMLAAVAWWVVRLGIRPIKQMTQTAARIAGGDREHRVPEMPPSTEAGQLGLALNHMLERLDDAFAIQAASEDRLRRFVADASHELRTPVTTIRGYAELYRVGGLSAPGELDEAMRRTEQEAVRMARLVDDLLNLAKLDEGRPLERRPVDLAALVADAARDAAAVDPGRPITTQVDAPIVVQGDEDRLRQVLANVVGNALVHTPAGTPIELRVADHDGTAELAVVDHGPGMPPEVAARVTQRFYRADAARSRHRGGSGLGMSIADAAVAAHGGTIAVDSAPGAGTTVTVTLPIA